MKVKKFFKKFGSSFDLYAIEYGKYTNGNNKTTAIKTIDEHILSTLDIIMNRHVDFISNETKGSDPYILIYTKEAKGERPL